MHGRKSRRLRSDGKLLKWLLKVSRPPRVFFYRSRGNRVLKALLETFYPNLLLFRKNVSLIYDGGLSSLIHQPFTGMVNPVRLGSHSDGTAIERYLFLSEKSDENVHRLRFGLSCHVLHRDV